MYCQPDKWTGPVARRMVRKVRKKGGSRFSCAPSVVSGDSVGGQSEKEKEKRWTTEMMIVRNSYLLSILTLTTKPKKPKIRKGNISSWTLQSVLE